MKDNWLNYYHMHRNFRLLPFLYFASVVLYPVNSVNTLKVMTQLSLSCFGYNIANWYAYKFRFDEKWSENDFQVTWKIILSHFHHLSHDINDE